ncbi:MAG: hypothetical protein WA061_02290 [Microgenomates group bacterium]
MSKLLKFTVNDYTVEENPQSHFAILNMKIVSDGDNMHSLPIETDAIRKASSTLFGKPVLADYLEDGTLGGHGETEIPIGTFLDRDVKIQKESDGKTWMYGVAYIWKRYFPHIMDVFKKNDGKTDISMEIEVTESRFALDGKEHIYGFNFLGVTTIGVTPAITGSGATVLQFSALKQKAEEEFSSKYSEIDFTIPQGVKDWCNKGLSFQSSKGGHPVSLAVARHIVKNDIANPKKVQQMKKFFEKNKDFEFTESDNPDGKSLSFMLHGAGEGRVWSNDVWMSMQEANNKKSSFFSAEENKMKEDEEDMDEKKKVEASSPPPEKEEEKVEEKMSAEEVPAEKEEEKKEEMSAEKEPEGVEDSPEEEKKETPEEEKKEEMSLDAYADVPAFLSMLESETEQHQAMAGMFAAGNVQAPTMYSAFYALAKKFADMKGEFEALKKFKADKEAEEFGLKVEASLKDVYAFLPKEEVDQQKEESKKFTLETFSAWETGLKAKAFEASKNIKHEDKKEEDVKRFPFGNLNAKKSNKKSLW